MKGDALVLINAIREDEECNAWFRNIVEDIKPLLKSLSRWDIGFIYRERNQVAHGLAKHDLLLHDEFIWLEEFPDVIVQSVLLDIAI